MRRRVGRERAAGEMKERERDTRERERERGRERSGLERERKVLWLPNEEEEDKRMRPFIVRVRLGGLLPRIEPVLNVSCLGSCFGSIINFKVSHLCSKLKININRAKI